MAVHITKTEINTVSMAEYGDLATAVAAIGSTVTFLHVQSTNIPANLTVPANITLVVSPGVVITVDSGMVLTINGGIIAGRHTIFSLADGTSWVRGGAKVDCVYPEWFGATGDGVTDDTDAIQDAINWCCYSHIGPCLLGPHTYSVSTLNIPEEVAGGVDTNGFVFAGVSRGMSILKGSAASMLLTVNTAGTSGASLANLAFRDFSIDGNSTTTVGLFAELIYHSQIERVEIYGCTSHGCWIKAGLYGSIRDCWMYSNGGNGLYMGQRDGTSLAQVARFLANAWNVYGGSYRLNTAAGIRIDNSSGISLIGSLAESNVTYDLHIDACTQIHVSDMYYENASGSTVMVFVEGDVAPDGGKTVARCTGITFSNCGWDSSPDDNILLQNADSTTFLGCRINNTLTIDSTCYDTMIVGGYVDESGFVDNGHNTNILLSPAVGGMWRWGANSPSSAHHLSLESFSQSFQFGASDKQIRLTSRTPQLTGAIQLGQGDYNAGAVVPSGNQVIVSMGHQRPGSYDWYPAVNVTASGNIQPADGDNQNLFGSQSYPWKQVWGTITYCNYLYPATPATTISCGGNLIFNNGTGYNTIGAYAGNRPDKAYLSSGIVLQSQDGTNYLVTVANDGVLTTVATVT